MGAIEWAVIIAKIILLVAEGMSKDQAVSAVAKEFGIPSNKIWEHGGF